MASREEVEEYLERFHLKMRIWDVLFLNRTKNVQTLADLEISPVFRKKVLEALACDDYSEGPKKDKMMQASEMWVFGKNVKSKEVYIKITMGNENLAVLCISFHIAEHPMNYPLKMIQ